MWFFSFQHRNQPSDAWKFSTFSFFCECKLTKEKALVPSLQSWRLVMKHFDFAFLGTN